MLSSLINNNAKQVRRSAELPPSTALFSGIDEKQLAAIMAAAYRKKVSAHQHLYHQGDKANRLFLLGAGGVKVYRVTKKGEEVVLLWLSPGDPFGIGAVLRPPHPYMGNSETIQDCEIYVWREPRLGELVRDCPQLVQNTLRIVLHRFSVHADQVVEAMTAGAGRRVAKALLRLGHERGRVGSNGVEVQVTNEDLSALAHVSPFTACRLLNKWKRSGRVEKTRGKVVIHSPELLVCD